MRHVCWDVTVYGAPDDRSAIFAAIRGICGPGDQKLCFSVALESGPTEFYVVDKDMINAALRGEEDKK